MAVWWRPAVFLRDGWMARRGVNDRYSSDRDDRDDRDRTMPVRDLTNVDVTSPGTKLLIGFAPSRASHQRLDGLLARHPIPHTVYSVVSCMPTPAAGRSGRWESS